MKNLYIILLIVAGIVLGYYLNNKPTEVIKTKEVETRIQLQKDTIHHYETTIVQKWKSNDRLESQIQSLADSLEVYKEKKDTVKIIEVQSKSIVKLKESNDTLKIIINYKDSIILKKDDIISAKDTIIYQYEGKIKKVKRQRNVSILLNVVQAVLAGIKN
jgi:uncharacterized coiled-coil protein SlyX